MRLRKIRVEGFQSFLDSGDVEFEEGFNLIIGQNNSGKSALLRAMLPTLPDDRHRTPGRWEEFKLAPPKIMFTIEASGVEIHDWSLRSGSTQHFPVSAEEFDDIPEAMKKLFDLGSVFITTTRVANASFMSSSYPSHGRFKYEAGTQQYSASMTPTNGELLLQSDRNGGDSLASLFWSAWQMDMFYFTAERLTIGEAPGGHGVRLHPNAANLPNVLHTLSSERGDVFKKLVDHVCEIFPTVGNLSVRSMPGSNNFEIRVWPTNAMERVELSFPLIPVEQGSHKSFPSSRQL